MKKVLGIFTCHNRKEKTEYCLDCLVKTNPDITFFFIAVDDNSTDGTKEMLEKRSDTLYIKGNGSLYYSGGMRKGMEAAKKSAFDYEYCLLFNDDVEFYKNSIENLIQYSGKITEVIIGAVCDHKEHLSYGGIKTVTSWKPAFQIVMSREKERLNCDTFNANCVLIPQKIFNESEVIDKKYTHSLGDFDYGFSLKKQGAELIATDFFVGLCCDNSQKGTWLDNSLSRRERLEKKEMPKGLPGKEWFYFIKKNFSVPQAVIFSITPYIKILLGR